MICEEIVNNALVEEYEQKLQFLIRKHVSERKKALNRAKIFSLEADQIYRAKAQRSPKELFHNDGEVEFCRHPNRSRNKYSCRNVTIGKAQMFEN